MPDQLETLLAKAKNIGADYDVPRAFDYLREAKAIAKSKKELQDINATFDKCVDDIINKTAAYYWKGVVNERGYSFRKWLCNTFSNLETELDKEGIELRNLPQYKEMLKTMYKDSVEKATKLAEKGDADNSLMWIGLAKEYAKKASVQFPETYLQNIKKTAYKNAPGFYLKKIQGACKFITALSYRPMDPGLHSLLYAAKNVAKYAKFAGMTVNLPKDVLTMLVNEATACAKIGDIGRFNVSEFLETMKEYATLAKLPIADETINQIKDIAKNNKHKSELIFAHWAAQKDNAREVLEHLTKAKKYAANAGVKIPESDIVELERKMHEAAYRQGIDDMYWRGKEEIHYSGKINVEKEIEDGKKVIALGENVEQAKIDETFVKAKERAHTSNNSNL